MPITQSWLDNGGLFQVYGVDQATTENGGEYRNNGELREIQMKLDLTTLTATNTVPFDNIFVPAGMQLQEVIVECLTAATSGGLGTFDVGLIRTDRSTVTAAAGIISAMPLASINAQGKQLILNVGSANVGTLIGTTTANVNMITVRFTTAAFTAGVLVVKLRYLRA